MNTKNGFVQDAGNDVWYQVPETNPYAGFPDAGTEVTVVRAKRDDDLEPGDAYVVLEEGACDALAILAGGERLFKSRIGGRYFLAAPPCGSDAGGCGCGCHGGWKVTVISPEKAAAWCFDHGIGGLLSDEEKISTAYDAAHVK